MLPYMQQGDVIADRFDIEALAASGGMGRIFRARDRHNGEFVAVKVLLGDSDGHDARFVHETRALAELSHPNIVRYVAHGVATSGERYLAMEWLEGEDLSQKLEQGELTIEESLTLARSLAAALGAAHARGIVHRDLKPSNIFLVRQRVDQVKVLDFGIARLGEATRVTRTGKIIGTPGYMAPEQVQNDRPVDARADVFSLGCVLFECITGVPAFADEHLMALLAKVLFAEPVRLRELRPEAPGALEQLLLRMMAKNPEERPRDGAAVARELTALDDPAGMGGSVPPKIALTTDERRTISVVMIEADGAVQTDGTTLDKVDADAVLVLRNGAEAFGGRFEHLRDGSFAMLIGGTGMVTDQAAQAARCALWLRTNAQVRAMALATRRGEIMGRSAAMEAIDWAAKLLFSRAMAADVGALPGIIIDEVTAGLLDGRFEVRQGEAGYTLHSERELADGARTLLGKATPCVGRDSELRILEQLFNECTDEPGARAMVLTAPPGTGKSRLLQEFLRTIHSRSASVSIWMGRGEPLRAGSAFGLISQMLRGACGIRDGEPLAVRREKLAARVATRVQASGRQRVAEFLGELVGAPFPDEYSLPLRAARKDAQLMNEQMRGAFLDLLRYECHANPVVLVLEDLHWGDRPTVQFIDHALWELRELPLFVVAMARPEVQELFPELWSDRSKQELLLKPLGKKASERLVQHVLGGSADEDVVERVVRLSEGNAFYLEELIRATAEGRGGNLPETVVAMVQSRLGALDDGSRRILRAASVFGEVFWDGAVASLLGVVDGATGMQNGLDELLNRELIVKRKESRFPSENEYAFRHALLREGAYRMLTDEDRGLGHRLAGEWLEQHGEQDPLALAEHFERGGEGGRAGVHYLRAADQALSGLDSVMAIAGVKQALACSIPDDLRLRCLGVLCELPFYHLDVSDTLHHAEDLLRVAKQGSAPWNQAMLVKLTGSIQAGDFETFLATLGLVAETWPERDAGRPWGLAVVTGIYLVDLLGQPRNANRFIEHLAAVVRAVGDHDPIVSAMLYCILAVRTAYAEEDPSRAMEQCRIWVEICTHMQHSRYLATAKRFDGMNKWYLGAFEEAECTLMGLISPDEEVALASSIRPFCLAWMLAERGAIADARAWANRLIAYGQSRRLPLDEGRGHWALAEVLRRAGELEDAERAIQTALAILAVACPLDHPAALTTLAMLRLSQDRAIEGLAAAEDALRRYETMGACGFFRGAFLRLIYAECLEGTGNHEAARTAIATARQCILTNAAKIGDPTYRKSFLENVPENRRTLELAQEWLGSP